MAGTTRDVLRVGVSPRLFGWFAIAGGRDVPGSSCLGPNRNPPPMADPEDLAIPTCVETVDHVVEVIRKDLERFDAQRKLAIL